MKQETIYISEHFTLAEATNSQTASRLGIDNSHPDPQIRTVASKTAVKMEKVRVILDEKPVNISSWIRSLDLNRALGSSDTSQHIKGEAVDFICPAFGSPLDICRALVECKDLIGWDQLILEHTWVHISWNSTPNSVQRGQVLSLLSGGKYATGLTDLNGNSLS
jgi:zinc D-Ala-D-Ala carboxypeptidase